jgi:hypothetical protein
VQVRVLWKLGEIVPQPPQEPRFRLFRRGLQVRRHHASLVQPWQQSGLDQRRLAAARRDSVSRDSMWLFQKRMLSGSPCRSRAPGSSARKKSASCWSNDRRPLGTMRIGWPDSVERCDKAVAKSSRSGVGVAGPGVRPPVAVALDNSRSSAWARKCRRSSAMSPAVEYRSVARLDKARRQIRSNSFGTRSLA